MELTQDELATIEEAIELVEGEGFFSELPDRFVKLLAKVRKEMEG